MLLLFFLLPIAMFFAVGICRKVYLPYTYLVYTESREERDDF